jgi:hypothetical protein
MTTGARRFDLINARRRKLTASSLAFAAFAATAALVSAAPASSDTSPARTADVQFVPTGSMSVVRNRPIAAPLPDGRVLVAGGEDMNPWSSAEIYDPATGSFSALGIGSLSKPREEAAAAALPDGDILIAGGASPPNGGNLADAELFDPVTGTFSAAGLGHMAAPRVGPAAASLPGGEVLIVGGFDGRDPVSSAEVFDPATLRFSSLGIGAMSTGRWGPVAAPLPDGKVLVAGGATRDGITASAEVFDPATGQFSSAGVGQMTTPRAFAMAAPLPDGKVLITGGISSNGGDPLSSAEVFDPKTGQFSSAGVGQMTTGRMEAGVAPLPDGDVLIAGGSGATGELSSAEVFDLTGNPVPAGPPSGMPAQPPQLSSHLVFHIFRYVRRRVTRPGGERMVRRRIITSTRYLRSSPIFTRARASAVLSRGHRTYATGSANLSRLVLNSRHSLAAGAYSLALRHRSGRHWLTTHTPLTVGG